MDQSDHQAPPELSVVIPMFREARRIRATLLDAVPLLTAGACPSEIVLVDDGSPDETIPTVEPFLTEVPVGSLRSVRLLRHRLNRGKGAAVRTGLSAAAGNWRLIMDADNAATIREAEKLVAQAKPGVGLVAGSRVAPGSVVHAVTSRRLTGLLFKASLRAMGLNLLTDTQCGFKLYRADLAGEIARHATEDGYAFDLEHLLIARACGLRVAEVGIAWTHQDGGQVSPVSDGLRMLRRAWSIRARRADLARVVTRLPVTLPASTIEPRPEPPLVVTLPASPAPTIL
ncbi:MAG: glycosyltransferase [Phycisphaerales bacterium]|nr:glycosyltransferase [Phycisphaerales bacterium]